MSEMSENGLRMACDLRLCLHIGLFCSFSPKRKYINDYFEIVIRNFTSRLRVRFETILNAQSCYCFV